MYKGLDNLVPQIYIYILEWNGMEYSMKQNRIEQNGEKYNNIEYDMLDQSWLDFDLQDISKYHLLFKGMA